MSEKNQDTKPTGFAAKMKKMMGGCGCGSGCCCGDIRIVPRKDAEETATAENDE